MSTVSPAIQQTSVATLARVGDRYFRYKSGVELPEGAIEVDLSGNLTKEQLEEMYAALAGTNVKKFKSREVALENVSYQVGKLPELSDSKSPQAPEKSEKSDKKYVRKSPSNYKLLVDAESQDKLKTLSPQALGCINILADFAKEVGRFDFQEAELKAYFESAKDRLKTKQDPWRILMYYRHSLVSLDLLRVS